MTENTAICTCNPGAPLGQRLNPNCQRHGSLSWDAIVNRPISDEQRKLARKVLAAVEARKNEDIDEWAERLAADVADAND